MTQRQGCVGARADAKPSPVAPMALAPERSADGRLAAASGCCHDIRLAVDFWRTPKTLRLVGRVGVAGAVSLQRLWCQTARTYPDGRLEGWDEADIEAAAGWAGEPGTLFRALVEGRWLDVDDAGVCSVHGWEYRQEFIFQMARRSLKAQALARTRRAKGKDASAPASTARNGGHTKGGRPRKQPPAATPTQVPGQPAADKGGQL